MIVNHPLVRVPENAMKLGVGLLLSSFGTFRLVEGVGGERPGDALETRSVIQRPFVQRNADQNRERLNRS